ncbi:MAG: 30S ribosome-binding factor RbfA [Phycisphaerales bacterium]|nr:30S ribosome-binding factor RbfA [Phycisphaerales bacterium]
MSRRTERVSHLIRNVIADAIRTEVSDPRLERLTSVTRVEISDDLSVARVYVSVMASEARRKLTLEALKAAAGRIRAFVRDQVTLRTLPRLTFFLDDSVRRAAEMVNTLDRLVAEADARSDALASAAAAQPASDFGDEAPLNDVGETLNREEKRE